MRQDDELNKRKAMLKILCVVKKFLNVLLFCYFIFIIVALFKQINWWDSDVTVYRMIRKIGSLIIWIDFYLGWLIRKKCRCVRCGYEMKVNEFIELENTQCPQGNHSLL